MRQMKMGPGRPRWRGLARRCRQLRAWAQAQGARRPQEEASYPGEVQALVRAPVQEALLAGTQGRAHRRAVAAALVGVLRAWQGAKGEAKRVVLYLRPDHLWDSSVDWHGDALGLTASWAAWEAQGAWVRAQPPQAWIQAWGLEGQAWVWLREADGQGGWRWLALAGDLAPWAEA